MRRIAAFFSVVLLGMAIPHLPAVSAAEGFFDNLSWSLQASMLIIPEDNGLEGDPSPILGSMGGGVSYSFYDFFALEVTLDFYGTHYGFPDSVDWPVPYAIENRSTLVIGSILGVQAVYRANFTDKIRLRVYGGPAADLRLCLIASGLEGADRDDASSQTDKIVSYFWEKGRWFYPVAGVGMDFTVTEKILAGFDLRAWFPVYKLWTGEDLPGVEGWRFAAGLRVTFR
ncbi:hypothetical protein [Breznakiella homolactica]|uniref:Outer membrane protein beta-barrel domain-containing protein n=1 Tax=Breznakiella homolactica TaxID=2798577 RepID=A0A7T7XRF4_9SPIR|nr:hypothetical protein [Breznakiella homolactica]QQO11064.1 hypothetical protein JFL75_09150 [Breznakiella homolactica]